MLLRRCVQLCRGRAAEGWPVAGRPTNPLCPTVAAVLSPAYAGTNAAHLRMQLMPVYGDRPTGAGVVWPATSAATRKDAINRALDLRTRASRCTHLRRRHVHQHKYHELHCRPATRVEGRATERAFLRVRWAYLMHASEQGAVVPG